MSLRDLITLGLGPSTGTGGTGATAEEIAIAVWDEILSGHLAPGSAGAKLNAGSTVDDPWATEIPGAYAEGTAGYIMGEFLDARISTLCEGTGAIPFTYTLTEAVSGDPIVGADVTVTSDAAGATLLAHATTNESGEVLFHLNAGTYYLWRQKAGYRFVNPDTEIVT